jgi:hypothetical protein
MSAAADDREGDPDPSAAAARRARRLLRWYPRAWQTRYGEEFTELLIADIEDRPRSRARMLDVARGGLTARLARAGLCGCAPDAAAQVRSGLAALGCCLAVFAGLGAALWSQLAIGWQWAQPAPGAVVAMAAASAAWASWPCSPPCPLS